jgi:hypothetical protein
MAAGATAQRCRAPVRITPAVPNGRKGSGRWPKLRLPHGRRKNTAGFSWNRVQRGVMFEVLGYLAVGIVCLSCAVVIGLAFGE